MIRACNVRPPSAKSRSATSARLSANSASVIDRPSFAGNLNPHELRLSLLHMSAANIALFSVLVFEPPQPRPPDRRRAADAVAELVQDAMHTPAHSLRHWLPIGSMPRIRPIVDLRRRQQGATEEGSGDLTLHATKRNVARISPGWCLLYRGPHRLCGDDSSCVGCVGRVATSLRGVAAFPGAFRGPLYSSRSFVHSSHRFQLA
jgi:hypothetical protein